ncbi:MAG: hypothetical protein Pg6C_03710 [Treponemataceae bacterium]|nr:MAG: hypothetical protein Pg6C_03710 [Treponemataceae bacterium]
MKTGKTVLFFGLIALCTASVFAQTEADFQTAANEEPRPEGRGSSFYKEVYFTAGLLPTYWRGLTI